MTRDLYSNDEQTGQCYCCGRPEGPFRPLLQSNKGLVCALDDFCRLGTDQARPWNPDPGPTEVYS